MIDYQSPGQIAVALVGVTFWIAGFSKAIEPQYFIRHLGRLGLLPRSTIKYFTVFLIAGQIMLGSALVLGQWTARLIPITMVLILVLGGVTYWSIGSGRVDNCGCYGGLVELSKAKSLGLDGVSLGLLWFGYSFGAASSNESLWKAATVLASGMTGGSLAVFLIFYFQRNRRLLFDLSPLKIGRAWRGILPAVDLDDGDHLVVFLGKQCPHCRKWIKLLNVVHRLGSLPTVLGVVGTPSSELSTFLDEAKVTFPTVAIEPAIMTRLVRGALPTGIVLKQGEIYEKWVANMPEEFIGRLRARLTSGASAAPEAARKK